MRPPSCEASALPGERVRPDAGEAPAEPGIVLVAGQQDVAAGGPAGEPPYPAGDGFGPGGTPGVGSGVVEPDRGTVKRRGRLALAGLAAAGNDPGVLHGAAARDPAGVQFAGRGGGLAVSAGSGPLQVPGARELPGQHQLAGVLAGRAGNVQGAGEPVIRPGWPPRGSSSLLLPVPRGRQAACPAGTRLPQANGQRLAL